MTKEELKKSLKKDLKKLQISDVIYVKLIMGKKQMDGNYAFISAGINNGDGWIDKREEIKTQAVEILKKNGCRLEGQDPKTDYNWIITY